MSNNLKRVEQFNALNTGTLLHVNEGVLVIDLPGNNTLTTHDRVQYDLGPVTATFASWCLDALLGKIETGIEPTDVQKGQILAMTRCNFPEKAPATVPEAADEKADKASGKKV